MPIILMIVVCLLFWADEQRDRNQAIVDDMANRVCSEEQLERVEREVVACVSSNIRPSICFFQAKKAICPNKEDLKHGKDQDVLWVEEMPLR